MGSATATRRTSGSFRAGTPLPIRSWHLAAAGKKRTEAGAQTGDARSDADLIKEISERLSESWAFCTSPDGLNLSPDRFWSLAWADIHSLVDVHRKRRHGEANRWAISHASFYNVHFRDKNAAPWLPEDFLGTGDHAKRTLEMQREKHEIAMENQRLAQIKRGTVLAGGGSTRVVDGVVHVQGVPDMFRLLAEQHEAKLAAQKATIEERTGGSPFGGKHG